MPIGNRGCCVACASRRDAVGRAPFFAASFHSFTNHVSIPADACPPAGWTGQWEIFCGMSESKPVDTPEWQRDGESPTRKAAFTATNTDVARTRLLGLAILGFYFGARLLGIWFTLYLWRPLVVMLHAYSAWQPWLEPLSVALSWAAFALLIVWVRRCMEGGAAKLGAADRVLRLGLYVESAFAGLMLALAATVIVWKVAALFLIGDWMGFHGRGLHYLAIVVFVLAWHYFPRRAAEAWYADPGRAARLLDSMGDVVIVVIGGLVGLTIITNIDYPNHGASNRFNFFTRLDLLSPFMIQYIVLARYLKWRRDMESSL